MKQGTVQLAPTELTQMRSCSVVVKKGPDKGSTERLEHGALVIGTAADCDLVLTDDTVSGRHCELILRNDQVVVRDLGSRNGVLLNGVRVLEAIAEKGAELKLGNSVLLVTPDQTEVLVAKASSFGPLYGASPAMRAVFAQLPTLAGANGPILIEGETGTGKDLTAEALHQASPRAAGPFVVFDCGAVAASLVESELFGHEKSAFTGAGTARIGLAEEGQRRHAGARRDRRAADRSATQAAAAGRETRDSTRGRDKGDSARRAHHRVHPSIAAG